MKRKVLIVEDNINLSQMRKDWFVQAGYDAITAVDATKARSLIRKVHFDLILSDVRLPDGDGISFAWSGCVRKRIILLLLLPLSMCLYLMLSVPLNWEL